MYSIAMGAASVLAINVVYAQHIPNTQWNKESQLWLARAMVAEAGWESTDDHVAIAWVLYRRWKIIRRSYPTVRFASVIRAYCAGLRSAAPVTRRQKWIRQLEWKDPSGWLSRYRDRWHSIRQLVLDWGRGYIVDACDIKAVHWGGRMDRAPKAWLVANCGDTDNTFYALRLPTKNMDD